MKLFFQLFLLGSLFLLSSCFQLVEEINLKADGSGTLSITLNLSQSKDQVNKILKQDTILGRKIPSQADIMNRLNELKVNLEKNQGISNVSVVKDFQTYIIKVSCSFSNVKALNQAILQIWKTYDKKAAENMEFISFSNQTLKRSFNPTLTGIKASYIPQQVKEVLGKADYLLVYKFEKKVLNSTNSAAIVAPSGKAVILKTKPLPVIQGKVKIDNEIKIN